MQKRSQSKGQNLMLEQNLEQNKNLKQRKSIDNRIGLVLPGKHRLDQ